MKRLIRRTLLALCTILSYQLLAQNFSDSLINVPGLVGKPDYTETTSFYKNKFTHSIYYNHRGSVDEEHDYSFLFVFTDFDTINPGQVINIATDTALLRCSFGVISVWSWDYESKASFSGTITLISKTKKEIVIEEDVGIRDWEGDIIVYKTRKIFVREKEK